MPWYRLEENLARVHRFYDQEAWETLVSGAEALDKQAHVEGFDQAQREAAELNDAAGPISEDRRNRMGQIYYSAKLHFHLMEFSDEARIGFERLKQQMRRIWPHHEDDGVGRRASHPRQLPVAIRPGHWWHGHAHGLPCQLHAAKHGMS